MSRCDACGEQPKGYCYVCKECNIYLDLVCDTPGERVLEHHGHPHPLTLLKREIETVCNCCGEVHGIFWIHQDCASHGPEVNAIKHPHPLQFVYSASFSSLKRHIYSNLYLAVFCEICTEKVDHRRWYLECFPCDFQSHVRCAMFEDKKDPVREIDQGIPRLTWEDCDGEFGIVGLLNKKIAANDEVEKEQTKINHFSHPEHELILQAEVPKVEDPYHGHQIPITTKCNGCTTKISSPFYSCMDCDFFLHRCCAFLPRSISTHPFHYGRHPYANLVQPKRRWRVEEVFICDCCKKLCNGFYFQCQEEHCTYKVEVECAFLPTSIVHKSHPHLLTLTMYSHFRRPPGCCGTKDHSGYECCEDECEFWIHIECAMYPGRASLRYDHENPFKLWYDRGAVEANYFYCERCEESMGPKEWYYHSKTSIGDQLMHPRCMLQREHPRCCYCRKIFNHGELYLAYKYWEFDCSFALHISCAMKLRGTNSIGVEEYPDESS